MAQKASKKSKTHKKGTKETVKHHGLEFMTGIKPFGKARNRETGDAVLYAIADDSPGFKKFVEQQMGYLTVKSMQGLIIAGLNRALSVPDYGKFVIIKKGRLGLPSSISIEELVSEYDISAGGQVVWKYPLDVKDRQVVKMPIGGKIMSVGLQKEVLTMWAMVEKGVTIMEDRVIVVAGTGETIKGDVRPLGMVMTADEQIVLHVFEEV